MCIFLAEDTSGLARSSSSSFGDGRISAVVFPASLSFLVRISKSIRQLSFERRQFSLLYWEHDMPDAICSEFNFRESLLNVSDEAHLPNGPGKVKKVIPRLRDSASGGRSEFTQIRAQFFTPLFMNVTINFF